MAKKVPNFTVSSHKGSRNAFDLSQSHLFQAAPGQLYPILSLDLIPDDVVDINVEDYVKSMPVVSSPLCSARGVYEFFFVPYHQLWHNFDQFITQMNDYRSSLFAQDNPPASIPTYGKKKVVVDGAQREFFDLSPAYLAAISNTDTGKDIFGYKALFGANVLYDFLGYGPFLNSIGQTGIGSYQLSLPDYAVNLFRLGAYNKIYQDWYRKTSYETYDVHSYSLDDLGTSAPHPVIRYRNYGLDLLTNLRPSASLNVNNQKVFDNIVPQMFGIDLNIYNHGSGTPTSELSYYHGIPLSSDNIDGVAVGSSFDPLRSLSSLNVNSIRAAFALDKLSQLIGRADKDYKSQMKAVYGVDVTEGRDGKAIFIGGFSSDIAFGEVDNTNGDSYGNKYSTYGKVFGNGNGHVKFKAPEFGVLMCIYSIIPFAPYDSMYVDRFNTKHSYSDYFNPLYQRLGLQPLYTYQITTDIPPTPDGSVMTSALGWQPRYSEYKAAVDRNHGGFNSWDSLSSFTASRSKIVSEETTEHYLQSLTLKDFKISPNIFDSVFAANFNGTQSTMPFYNKCSFSIVKVSTMDVDSLPLI